MSSFDAEEGSAGAISGLLKREHQVGRDWVDERSACQCRGGGMDWSDGIMAVSFLPSTDAGLLTWSTNFSQRLSEHYEAYGVPLERAEAYAALDAAYAVKYQIAANPSTRTHSMVMQKNEARRALKVEAGLLALLIRGQKHATDVQKADLGLTVPSKSRAPIGRPESKPSLRVLSTNGLTVELALNDPDHIGRGRPRGCAGAIVFYAIGAEPEPGAKWEFAGLTTEMTFTMVFPADVPAGTQIWFSAQWLNPRLQRGRGAAAVTCNLPGGAGNMYMLGSKLNASIAA